MSKQEHILVTGGAGFIGSHLVERLLADGKRVTVIDDCSTGSIANLAAVRDNPRLTMFQGKVSACAELEHLVQDVDFIYHLAAAVGVDNVVNSPIRTIRTNLDETEVILNAASVNRTPILITSTSEVYGKSSKPSFSEEDDLLIGPPHLGRWSYACSKLMDEFLALAHTRERKLPVIIARLFNTVGPRQTGHYGMVLPRFIAAARSGAPLRVFGDGKQTRCFCFVADTVYALERLRTCDAARGEVLNIGGTQEISILELAEQVKQLLQSSSKIEFVSYGDAYAPGFEDMSRRRPSVEKLARTIGFTPSRPIEEIIRLTAGVK